MTLQPVLEPPTDHREPHRSRWRLAVAVAVAFALSRVATTAIFWWVARHASPNSRIGVGAGVVQAMNAWDGQWYQLIAGHGYPAHLPAALDGVPLTSAWAFLPLYPALVHLLTFGRAALWPIGAELTSTVFGLAAAVTLAELVRRQGGERTAFRTALVFVCSPVAFVLQIAYADAMGLFLLFVVLLLIDRRHPVAAMPFVVLLAFTRPGVEAVALLVGVLLVLRVARRLRGPEPLPPRELVADVGLLVVAVAGSAAWPAIAAAATGVPDAYVVTELAWRSGWLGSSPLVPFQQWAWAADFWFGGAGPLVLGTVAALAVVLVVGPRPDPGRTIRGWGLAWLVYLAAVFFPQSSVFRLMMPMAPSAAGLVARMPRWVLAIVVVGSLAAQAWWVWSTYGAWTHYWSVP